MAAQLRMDSKAMDNESAVAAAEAAAAAAAGDDEMTGGLNLVVLCSVVAPLDWGADVACPPTSAVLTNDSSALLPLYLLQAKAAGGVEPWVGQWRGCS